MCDVRTEFHSLGFVVTPGLISSAVIEEARDALSRRMARAHQAGDAALHSFRRDAAIRACFTKELRAFAAGLARVGRPLRKPLSVLTITVMPTARAWERPLPHIDHANKEDGHRTFPPAFRLGCIVYLSDVRSQSGATIVWPGSHARIEALAKSDPERYQYRWALNRDLTLLDLGDPAELRANAGDVLFYHHLLAHAGSMNTGAEPRFALNHKW